MKRPLLEYVEPSSSRSASRRSTKICSLQLTATFTRPVTTAARCRAPSRESSEVSRRGTDTSPSLAFSVSIKGNVVSNRSEAIRELVLTGVGVSVSPEWLFAADVRQGAVVTILTDYRAVALPISAIFSHDRRRSARTRAFVDFLRERL